MNKVKKLLGFGIFVLLWLGVSFGFAWIFSLLGAEIFYGFLLAQALILLSSALAGILFLAMNLVMGD